MNNIQEFIQSATKELGTDEQSTRSATSGVLGFLKGQVKESDFKQLLANVPGSEALLGQSSKPAEQKAGTGSGLLGGLAGQVGAAVGGTSQTGILQVLQKSGLDLGKIGPFVSLFFKFTQQKAGSDLMGRLFDQVPDLKKLAG